jgi:hypothetical protein
MPLHNEPLLLEGIQEIVLTTLYTACVKNAVPVSLILVAASGTAKSKTLEAYNGPSIHKTDSFSSNGLFDLMMQDRDGKLRWIITVDLNPTLSRKSSTVESTMANLLTLTQDGTCRVDDGRKEKVAQHKPIGLISAVTPDMFQKQTKKWFALGLRRRIIPVFYAYSNSAIEALKKAVREDKISGANFPKINLKLDTEKNPTINQLHASRLESLGVTFATNLGLSRFNDRGGSEKWYVRKIVPISPIVTLRTLAKAHAIYNKREVVTDEDVDFMVRFLDFTNESLPKLIG